MSGRPKKGSVYWIRLQMQPTPVEQQHMDARSALCTAYRTKGVASASMVSEADPMNLIRNGIAEALTEDNEE